MRKVKHTSRYIMLMRTCRGNVLNHLEKNITIQDNLNGPKIGFNAKYNGCYSETSRLRKGLSIRFQLVQVKSS